jgi:hypothetical protein
MFETGYGPRMGRRFRRTLVALAIAAVPAAAGCGADEASAVEIVTGAPAATVGADTARMSFSVTMPDVPELGDTPLTGEGRVDFANGIGAMSFDLGPAIEAAGEQVPDGISTQMEMLFEGTTYYMRFPLLAEAFGPEAAGKEWIKIEGAEVAAEMGVDLSELQQMGNDPRQQLAYLSGVSDDVEEVGDDVVRGVDVTHYRATVTVDDILEGYEEDDRLVDGEQLRRQLESLGMDEIDIDVWIDEEGRARRMDMAMPMPAESGAPGELEVSMEMFDFGAPVDVVPPPADATFDATALAMQGG